MDIHRSTTPLPKHLRSSKAVFREPTEDDPRTRITRTEEEMRKMIITFRISRREMDELYRFARARSTTMSFMIREALVAAYPEIFATANRYIKRPKRPKPLQEKTVLQKSLADGTIRVIDTSAEKNPLNE